MRWDWLYCVFIVAWEWAPVALVCIALLSL